MYSDCADVVGDTHDYEGMGTVFIQQAKYVRRSCLNWHFD
jgi:hypothetical protein